MAKKKINTGGISKLNKKRRNEIDKKQNIFKARRKDGGQEFATRHAQKAPSHPHENYWEVRHIVSRRKAQKCIKRKQKLNSKNS